MKFVISVILYSTLSLLSARAAVSTENQTTVQMPSIEIQVFGPLSVKGIEVNYRGIERLWTKESKHTVLEKYSQSFQIPVKSLAVPNRSILLDEIIDSMGKTMLREEFQEVEGWIEMSNGARLYFKGGDLKPQKSKILLKRNFCPRGPLSGSFPSNPPFEKKAFTCGLVLGGYDLKTDSVPLEIHVDEFIIQVVPQ